MIRPIRSAAGGPMMRDGTGLPLRRGHRRRCCWRPWRCRSLPRAADGLLEKRESLYNNIFIFGDGDNVTMTFGQNKRYYTESSMKLSDPGALTVDYTRYMTLGIAYPPKVERILEIGLGGGRTVSYLSAALPDTAHPRGRARQGRGRSRQEVFQVHRRRRGCATVVSDGRAFLMRDSDKWDVILIDAYRGPFVPFHLLTKEFYTLVKSRLNAGRGGGAEHRALDHAVRFGDRHAQERVSLGRPLRRRRQRGRGRL